MLSMTAPNYKTIVVAHSHSTRSANRCSDVKKLRVTSSRDRWRLSLLTQGRGIK